MLKLHIVRAIRAELHGSGQCSAEGITATGHTPALELCRLLVEAGHHPKTPLHAYRGNTMALRIQSIGDAAALEINSKGTGFVKYRHAVRAAPPVVPTSMAVIPTRNRALEAM